MTVQGVDGPLVIPEGMAAKEAEKKYVEILTKLVFAETEALADEARVEALNWTRILDALTRKESQHDEQTA